MREKAQRTQEMAQDAVETESGVQALPLRYVNPNYTIVGVPGRDLSADEARRYGARIAAAQACSGVVIYQESE